MPVIESSSTPRTTWPIAVFKDWFRNLIMNAQKMLTQTTAKLSSSLTYVLDVTPLTDNGENNISGETGECIFNMKSTMRKDLECVYIIQGARFTFRMIGCKCSWNSRSTRRRLWSLKKTKHRWYYSLYGKHLVGHL